MPRLPETVETPRLTLRVWRDADATALADAIDTSLAHLRPWMPWADQAMTVAETAEFISDRRAKWEAGGDAIYGVFAAGVVVGGCGLHANVGPDVLEIGYWVHVDHTRQGYATELAAALTDAAFTVPGVERVEIHHDRANAISRRVPERLGFTFDAERPAGKRAPGEEGPEWIWAVGRSDWMGRRLVES
ncbi:MAG: GNAT family N-acetyltransferase [Acidimicrobiales bacterium]